MEDNHLDSSYDEPGFNEDMARDDLMEWENDRVYEDMAADDYGWDGGMEE